MKPARVFGRGPMRLIAVHGWMADHRLFHPLLDHLNASRVTCALIDCRGYGTRRDEPPPYTIKAISEDVLAAAEHLGWDRFHVLGHSMGGMAAQRLVVDAPARLLSAILVAPVPASGASVDRPRRELLLRAVTDASARRALIRANTPAARTDRWVEALLNLSLESTTAALEPYIAAWSDTDFATELKGSDVPVLAICGELDPAVPPDLVRRTIQVWCANASLHVIPGAGHYLMCEEPGELARLLLHLSICVHPR